MAVLEVLAWPNPFLRKRAGDVEDFGEALQQIVSDMQETMLDRDGIGLAATQVGIDLRMVLLDPYAFEGEDGAGKPAVVVCNPEVVWQSDDTETGDEGCLSFPGVFIPVERPRKVRIRAQDAKGETFELEAEGLGARAILHEIDHIDGVVMIDHVSRLVRARALKKHKRNQAAAAKEREEER